MIRYINSQVEGEKVGVRKQLMDFYTVCLSVTEQEEEEQERKKEVETFLFLPFGNISEKISEA